MQACSTEKENHLYLLVKNGLELERNQETVELNRSMLGMDEKASLSHVFLKNPSTGEFEITQTIDKNNDGQTDILLFQPALKPMENKFYEIIIDSLKSHEATQRCYSRFVPERTDDYAWENDRVAFRTFGPTAQQMIEQKIKGGTLTSGMDAWLKKVDYPIINKWYKKELSGEGSYHEDTGEGLDNFHVGISRGVGGIAIKKGSNYFVSKNFTSWQTISTGPLRTSFILTYADWDADGVKVSEKKIISLDYGSNLSKFEISIEGTSNISAGLTLHEKDGKVNSNLEEGWISYWEPHGESELGTGIVIPDQALKNIDHYLSDKKDESNLYGHIEVSNGTAIYYAGFGWKESGQFDSVDSWETYLSQFSQKLNKPIKTEIKKSLEL